MNTFILMKTKRKLIPKCTAVGNSACSVHGNVVVSPNRRCIRQSNSVPLHDQGLQVPEVAGVGPSVSPKRRCVVPCGDLRLDMPEVPAAVSKCPQSLLQSIPAGGVNGHSNSICGNHDNAILLILVLLLSGNQVQMLSESGDPMVGKTSFNTDAHGWTWIMRNNKQETSKHIRNPFQKDVQRIAKSFFITNFPEHIDAKGLWKVCESYGHIVDSFSANKRLKAGKRFGFVRFVGIQNEEAFSKSLSSIWIGSFHLFASVARFQR
ncbi:RNA-directed DNA polymerase, eukaryota, reverse transcriptase zinc-binding domain protein [Tanacetum coccineum]